MKKIFNLQTLIILIIILLPTIIHAQPPSNADPNIGAPVDGGLSLLIAGGVGYGIKKMRDKKR